MVLLQLSQKRAGCFRQLNSLISTDFSYFSDLRSGVQIFNFGLTELVGEKKADNMGRDSLLQFPDVLKGTSLYAH